MWNIIYNINNKGAIYNYVHIKKKKNDKMQIKIEYKRKRSKYQDVQVAWQLSLRLLRSLIGSEPRCTIIQQ